jgi:hypothetical protein
MREFPEGAHRRLREIVYSPDAFLFIQIQRYLTRPLPLEITAHKRTIS